MRYLILLGLLCYANAAFAQASPPANYPEAARQAPPAPDTAAAIHRLFAAERRRSAVVISATAGTGLLCLAVAEGTRHSYTIDATPIIATGISLLSIPAVITEIGFYRQFTRRKEQRAQAAFEAHQLPEKIKRRLHFESSAVAPPVAKHP